MKNFTKPGFTLVELLVTVSIMTLLFAYSADAFRNINNQQNIDQDANLFKAKLIQVQSMAIAPPAEYSGYEGFGLSLLSSNPLKVRPFVIKNLSSGGFDYKFIGADVVMSKTKITNRPDLTNCIFYIGNSPKTVCSDGSVFEGEFDFTLSSLSNSMSKTVTVNTQSGAIYVR